MADIKVFDMADIKDDNALKAILNNVKYFSDDIGMDFGLDKCAEVTSKKERITETY